MPRALPVMNTCHKGTGFSCSQSVGNGWGVGGSSEAEGSRGVMMQDFRFAEAALIGLEVTGSLLSGAALT